MRENSIEKKTECKVLFFLIHTSKLNQQRQRDVVSKSAAKIYPSNKYDLVPTPLLLTNHETPNNLNIVLFSQSEPFYNNRSATGWSVVCDCGISWLNSFTIYTY